MKITEQHILDCVPHALPKLIGSIVANWNYAEQRGIMSERYTAWFLGNAAVESAGFTRLEENLFYTTPERLMAVWPSRFKSRDAAMQFVRNPQKLANFVYGGRLGNTEPNDGYDYRGSGIFQTTGKSNFAEVSGETGIDFVTAPDNLRLMPHAFFAAVIFWQNRNLGRYADAGDYEGITRAIQGGTGGLEDRRLYINRFMRVLGNSAGFDVLKRGSRGPAVQKLQQRLAVLGFYGGTIDGMYGPGTANAVVAFQQANNIVPADGVVGPVTGKAIYAVS